jgi:uncharacterized protein (TIGR02246 family)
MPGGNLDADAIATDLLTRWADAIAARDLDAIATLFAPDAVFVATAPTPLVGQAAIRAYYDAAPLGLSVVFDPVLAARQRDGFAIVANVTFDIPGRGTLSGRLCLACGPDQAVRLYHLATGTPEAPLPREYPEG